MSEAVESAVFFTVDGKEYCDEERALAEMLLDEVLFSNGRKFISPRWVFDPENPGRLKEDGPGDIESETVVLFVICNDLFCWGTADAESLPHAEIGNLYRAWKGSANGAMRWCCLRRGLRPQAPIEKRWREGGLWDDQLEALPPPEPS